MTNFFMAVLSRKELGDRAKFAIGWIGVGVGIGIGIGFNSAVKADPDADSDTDPVFLGFL